MQQSRAIVVTGDNHKKLWKTVKEEFAKFDDSEYCSECATSTALKPFVLSPSGAISPTSLPYLRWRPPSLPFTLALTALQLPFPPPL